MANATVASNLIPVRHVAASDGDRLIVDVPNGWDDTKKICKKVLQYEGKNYTFRGWNSDRNEAFFVEGGQFAKIKH
jgi:hypothetical protein